MQRQLFVLLLKTFMSFFYLCLEKIFLNAKFFQGCQFAFCKIRINQDEPALTRRKFEPLIPLTQQFNFRLHFLLHIIVRSLADFQSPFIVLTFFLSSLSQMEPWERSLRSKSNGTRTNCKPLSLSFSSEHWSSRDFKERWRYWIMSSLSVRNFSRTSVAFKVSFSNLRRSSRALRVLTRIKIEEKKCWTNSTEKSRFISPS